MNWIIYPRTKDYRGFLIVNRELRRYVISTDGVSVRGIVYTTMPKWVAAVMSSEPGYEIEAALVAELMHLDNQKFKKCRI